MKLRLSRNNGSLLGIQKKIPLNSIVLPPLTPALSSQSDVEVIGIGGLLVSKQHLFILSGKFWRIRDAWRIYYGKLLSTQKRPTHPRAWHGKLNNQYFCVGVWVKRATPASHHHGRRLCFTLMKFRCCSYKKVWANPSIIYVHRDSALLLVFYVSLSLALVDC